jgi:crotonobetainyl-CoA:carnitine CoA-transferase CaiB-like acyl-CoA transferase
MAGPLCGVRVVDVTTMISGPLATRILADQGADVIKVERCGTGDLARGLGGRGRGMAPIFATINRSKRSIALDLGHERGLELLMRLVATADIFVQNFRPGVAERMGIGEATLRRARSDLIYVSISGFGERGPYVGKRVYDPVIQALSGLASVQGAGSDRPRMVRLIVPDKLTGVTAAQAITAALFARERGGQGQHVRLSMLDTMVAFLWPEAMAQHTFMGRDIGATRPADARDLIFRTRDGYMTAGTVSDAEWEAFVREAGRPDLAEDSRFRTAAGRVKHANARLERMAEVLATRTTADWVARLDAAGVPCAPISTREDLLHDPQLIANELIVETEHPHAGRMRQPRPAERFDRTPSHIARPAPLLGEHTNEILDELGIARELRDELRALGVLGPDPNASA